MARREGGPLNPVHGPAALLAVIALAGTPLVLAVPMRATTAHGALATWSVVASVLGLALFALAAAPGVTGGLCQRGAALVLTAWVAVAALRLGRTPSSPTETQQTAPEPAGAIR